MEKNIEKFDESQSFEIDQTKTGKLSVSKTVLKKIIYHLLTSENYQVAFHGIKIISKENVDLEAQIQVMVNKRTDLTKLKEEIIKLILKRINAVLNINVTNINLIFSSE